jgi:hypothetical protein
MANKKAILRMPNLGSGAIQIFDFRFRILDLKTVSAIEP